VHVEPTLGAIVRAYGELYLARYDATPRQRAVMRHIGSCHTSALGGHEYVCESCGVVVIAWHSCRDRHCPRCQGRESAKWVDAMRGRILPTHYFHVVFTIPHELNVLVLLNKQRMYDIQFAASAETLKTLLADPKRLGAKPAFTSVLHTWTQELKLHVHVHSIVSGGGLSPDGQSWIASPRDFLVHVKPLAKMFRGKYMDLLERALADTERPLNLVGDVACLKDRDEFKRLKDRLFLKEWRVYVKEALSGPVEVCKYFARYTHRVGISNKRIVSVNDGRVTFLARHRAKDGTYLGQREVTLDVFKFIRRFLLHTLPRGYTRVRHYGLTAPRNVKTQIPLARGLIKESASVEAAADTVDEPHDPPPDPSVCPHCGGRMLVLRGIDPHRTEYLDTS
jgi:DNA-directed RNA polymerase subunit RPC12/RpoP